MLFVSKDLTINTGFCVHGASVGGGGVGIGHIGKWPLPGNCVQLSQVPISLHWKFSFMLMTTTPS